MADRNKRVMVAMSGGVDSSVAAAKLKEQGYEVFGVTLSLHAEMKKDRPALNAKEPTGLSRACQVADLLGVKHSVLDLSEDFETLVLRPSWSDYQSGRTPNPCCLCNERIKFGLLLDWARDQGVGQLATGHYVRLFTDQSGRPSLFRGVDRQKDQSYFLAGLSSSQLSSLVFPLGETCKTEIRQTARRLNLPNADSPESQDACLVGKEASGSLAEILQGRFLARDQPGEVIDSQGNILGRHLGIHRFTVGQRRGLGIQSQKPCWVKTIFAERAAVLVTDDPQELMSNWLITNHQSWIDFEEIEKDSSCEVQVRYRSEPKPARIEKLSDSSWKVVFEKPVRAVTPGQAAVFYREEKVLGRGWIQSVGL